MVKWRYMFSSGDVCLPPISLDSDPARRIHGPPIVYNTAVGGGGGFTPPPPPRPTRLRSVAEICGKRHSKDCQKLCRNYFGHFSLGSKLWLPGAKNAIFLSFSRIANITSENLHYLGNYDRKRHSKENEIIHRNIIVRFDLRSTV